MDTLPYKAFGNTQHPRLIYLHGWGYSYAFFPKFIEEASKSYYVICINFPGYNGSNPLPSYSIEKLAHLLENTLKNLEVKKGDIIVAHSMATLIIMPLLKNLPEIRIILNGCPLTINAPGYAKLIISTKLYLLFAKSKMITSYFNDITKKAVSGFSKGTVKTRYDGDGEQKTVFLNTIANLSFKTAPYIETIKTNKNILLTYGEHDSNKRYAKELSIPVYEIKGAGHNSHEDAPEAFLKVITYTEETSV